MDLSKLIAELRSELEDVDRAIDALSVLAAHQERPDPLSGKARQRKPTPPPLTATAGQSD